MSLVDESKVYVQEGEDIVIEKKIAPAATKTKEKGGIFLGPMVLLGWKSMAYSAPTKETISLVGKSTGMPGGHLRGFHTPDCWGRLDEIGSPTVIFWQKTTRGTSLANPNGAIYAIDALCPYRLVGCGGDEGRGCSELLGECGSARCSGRTQASIPHLGRFKEAMVQQFEPVTEVEEA